MPVKEGLSLKIHLRSSENQHQKCFLVALGCAATVESFHWQIKIAKPHIYKAIGLCRTSWCHSVQPCSSWLILVSVVYSRMYPARRACHSFTHEGFIIYLRAGFLVLRLLIARLCVNIERDNILGQLSESG